MCLVGLVCVGVCVLACVCVCLCDVITFAIYLFSAFRRRIQVIFLRQQRPAIPEGVLIANGDGREVDLFFS